MFDTMVNTTISEAVARQTTGIPAGLDKMEPGPFLGIVLSGIDLDRLCGSDRGGRHEHGWTYRYLPNGDIEWTSPLGHTYITRKRDP